MLRPEAQVSEQPLVLVVPETAADEQTRQKAARFIGAVITGDMVEAPHQLIEKPIDSLHDALQKAQTGDADALKLIKANVTTEAVEQTIKSGHVGRKVQLVVTPEGKIIQHRQSYDSLQANSLRIMAGDPVLQPRTEAETRNGFRIEEAYRQGYFEEDYSFVVFSRAEDIEDVFFTDTMSCSIQVTSKANGGLATEPAFVAGIKKPGGQQHDEATIIKLYAAFGVDISGKSPAEIIDTPLLIHNSLIPNGVIDLVALYDKCAGGTFFGESKPQQVYVQYLKSCYEREELLGPIAETIVRELIDEAPGIKSQLQAIQRLHKLTEKHMVEQAVTDHSINPLVFGRVAATHIEEARLQQQQGNLEQAELALNKAQSTAKSTSCPTALRKSEKDLFDNLLDQLDDNPESTEASESNSGLIRCINCRKSVPKEKVVKKDCWKCPKCDYKVDICTGEVLNPGKLEQKPPATAKIIDLFVSKPSPEQKAA